MNLWPSQAVEALNAFYGNPDPHGEGTPDRAWEDANITFITPPYPMVLAWAPATPVSRIRVHKKAATSLANVLTTVRDHYGDQKALEQARMHLYGGAYCFRLMRGSPRLSVHSWGCAIDLDPGGNPMGRRWSPVGMMPLSVVQLFAAEGWVWGGKWSNPDAMHMQAATV